MKNKKTKIKIEIGKYYEYKNKENVHFVFLVTRKATNGDRHLLARQDGDIRGGVMAKVIKDLSTDGLNWENGETVIPPELFSGVKEFPECNIPLIMLKKGAQDE